MNDVYIVYCLFMYIFTLGIVVRCFSKDKNTEKNVKIGMVINLILAPVITPFVLGALVYEIGE